MGRDSGHTGDTAWGHVLVPSSYWKPNTLRDSPLAFPHIYFRRALWDALTGVVFVDDKQVVAWSGEKRYVDTGEGVDVTVRVPE